MRTCPKCGEAMEDPFDSCWKCAGNQSATATPRRRLKPADYIIAALIAYLIPWVAILIQWSVWPYSWWYSPILANFTPTMFLWAIIPGAINFLILLPFLKHPIQSRIVAIILLLSWTWMMLSAIAKVK